MYNIATEVSFDAAHFLKNYDGKCKNIHGHRWRVVISTKSDDLQENMHLRGMVTDFKDLKSDLNEVADMLDHTLIYEKESLSEPLKNLLTEEGFELTEVDFRPTAENFSKYFYDLMKQKGHNVTSAAVYETPSNYASYSEE